MSASRDGAAEPTVWQPTPADKKRYTKGEIETRIRQSEKRVERYRAACEIGVPHPSQILDLKICDPAMGSGAFLVEACRQLGDELIRAWYAHDMVPSDIPADEDEVLNARRLVAQRCLYGVDKNVMAVDLAKLSLWLVTLARDHAFTFLDHSLRHGDSLVGLTREQIIGFHWDRKKFKTLLNEPLQKRLDRATEARAKILNAREDVPYKDQEQRLAVADEALDLIRELGDACVSCFFAQSKKKAREDEADRVYGLASSYLESIGTSPKRERVVGGVDHASRQSLAQAAARLHSGEHPVPAFHWEIEFPEVFSRENGGFDAFVGNPPFLGGNKISGTFGRTYLDFQLESHNHSHGSSDLVAYFFRKAFTLARKKGCLGLIATKTVRQGETKNTGLEWIRKNGGTIFSAERRLTWPGQASVIVCVIHICRGVMTLPIRLDGIEVGFISAFLFHTGGDDDPAELGPQCGIASKGVDLGGKGFLFADGDDSCTPLAVKDDLLKLGPPVATHIKPYVGGSDLNDSPTPTPPRWVIDLNEYDDPRALPELRPLVSILDAKVGVPRRNGRLRELECWRYERSRDTFFLRTSEMHDVLVIARVSQTGAFCIVPARQVFNEKVVVFLLDQHGAFCVLQSRIHDTWARFFNTTMKDDMQYTLSKCFDTFPFPSHWAENESLDDAGRECHEFRRVRMTAASEGLTDTYNRFHSPDERDEGILELRRLHGLMDGAVLRAYGWDDLAESARCEFLLDYEEEEDDEPGTKKSRKKKPWRYRWPDDFRDEVLARLLELNEQRHKEELLAGPKTTTTKAPRKKPTKRKKPAKTPLFSQD